MPAAHEPSVRHVSCAARSRGANPLGTPPLAPCGQLPGHVLPALTPSPGFLTSTGPAAPPQVQYHTLKVHKNYISLTASAVQQLWPDSKDMELKQTAQVTVHTATAAAEGPNQGADSGGDGAEPFVVNLVSYGGAQRSRQWRLGAATALLGELRVCDGATVCMWRDEAGRVVAAATCPAPEQQGQQEQQEQGREDAGKGDGQAGEHREAAEGAAVQRAGARRVALAGPGAGVAQGEKAAAGAAAARPSGIEVPSQASGDRLPRDHSSTPAATPSSAALLPASSLTPAHLYGYAGPAAVPPPLQPGELRACGSTFHPELAPDLRAGLQQWAAEHLGGEQHAGYVAAALSEQVWVLGEGPAGWGAGAAAAEGELPWLGVLRQHGVSRNILAAMLSERLGLQEDRHDLLPGCLNGLPRELPDTGHVEPCPDPLRGGVGLRATAPFRKSHPVEVLAGYVMPERVAKRFGLSGYRDAGAGVAAAVEARAGNRRWAPHAWQLLVGAYSVPYHGPAREASAGMHGGGGEGQGDTGLFLQLRFAAWVAVLYNKALVEASAGGWTAGRSQACSLGWRPERLSLPGMRLGFTLVAARADSVNPQYPYAEHESDSSAAVGYLVTMLQVVARPCCADWATATWRTW